MLGALVQFLDPFDDPLVLFGLHRDRDRHPAENECRANIVVFGDALEIGHLEPGGRPLKYIGEVLGEQTIESLEGAETQDPVVGKLGSIGTTGLSKIVCVSVWAGCLRHSDSRSITTTKHSH